MAEKVKRRPRPSSAALNPQDLVESYGLRLKAAGGDAKAFDTVFDEVQADTSLKLTHLATLAQRYAPGIKRPASKTLAFAAISKRFVEVVKEHRRRHTAKA